MDVCPQWMFDTAIFDRNISELTSRVVCYYCDSSYIVDHKCPNTMIVVWHTLRADLTTAFALPREEEEPCVMDENGTCVSCLKNA